MQFVNAFPVQVSKYDNQSKVFLGREQTDCTASCYVGRYTRGLRISQYTHIFMYTHVHYIQVHTQKGVEKGALGSTITC